MSYFFIVTDSPRGHWCFSCIIQLSWKRKICHISDKTLEIDFLSSENVNAVVKYATKPSTPFDPTGYNTSKKDFLHKSVRFLHITKTLQNSFVVWNWDTVNHLNYSTDLPLPDFHLFIALKLIVSGHHFGTDPDKSVQNAWPNGYQHFYFLNIAWWHFYTLY